jgi:ribonucleotide reductase alpha subunit
MLIKKSNGKEEKVSFTKLTNRIEKQNNLAGLNLDISEVIQKIYSDLFCGITTDEVEVLIVDKLLSQIIIDPKFNVLASRISISNLHKHLPTSKFSLSFKKLFDSNLVDVVFFRFVRKYNKQLDEAFDLSRDYKFQSVFALETFKRSYLLKNPVDKKIMESPQSVFMRVALTLGYKDGIETVLQIYHSISSNKYIHGSPTLFNAATKRPALASCFLLTVEDSVKNIYEQLTTTAMISSSGGGIGVDFSHVRGKNSLIKSTNSLSNGIIPFIQVFDSTTCINQAGKRNGSFAIYLRPSHPDFLDFLELKSNIGGEKEGRARKLFYGIWASDTFMRYVKSKEFKTWYFFDPSENPLLYNTYGEEHFQHYQKAVEEKKYYSSVSTEKIWLKILDSQLETGGPYLCFACTANNRSNLKHWGEVNSSNLCCSGDTLLLTNLGYFKLKDLENETVEAWNGKEFSEITVRRTNERAAMKKIYFNNGLMLQCTQNHKFYIQNFSTKKIECIEAKDLRKGMVLEKYTIPPGTFAKTGEPHFDIRQKNPPLQGNRTQIENWLLHHFKNNKKKNHIENLGGFLLSQQLIGQKDVKTFIYKIDDEITYGPTFCATEEKEGRLLFNGVLTGNCSEIMLPSTKDNVAVCNLSSINLTEHVDLQLGFDLKELRKTVAQTVRNLNYSIDNMYYPHPHTESSNKLHRPIGIGVQGLADVFFLNDIGFESEKARELNFKIFEHIYYAAYEESSLLAEEFPEKIPESFKNSALSKGLFQFDFYPEEQKKEIYSKLTLNWDALKERVKKHGVLNMLTTCVMPTATTSSVFDNFECIEPPLQNLYNRSTNSGTFITINKYLVKKLQSLDLWNKEIREKLLETNGSIQLMKGIPTHVKEVYKTAFEIDQKVLVQLAIDRQPFIDHSQSLNLFITGKKSKQVMTDVLFHGWMHGLKTGVYYTRSRPALLQNYNPLQCSLDNKDCEACSS